MKIQIAFSCPIKSKIGSKAISWWIDKPYSHVLIIFEYADSKSAVFQASHGMVHFTSLDRFEKNNKILKKYEIDLSPDCHSKFFDDCMDLAGDQYSIPELAQIFIVDLIYKIFGKDIHSEDMPGYICSELVGKFCINQLNLKFDKPTYLLKPSDIDDKLALCSYSVTTYNK